MRGSGVEGGYVLMYAYESFEKERKGERMDCSFSKHRIIVY